MKKQYVPKTLTEYLSESKSITLKRKYGQRPTVTAGTNAPLRNQVLSFVAENAQVSKRDLKQFIIGLKEGGATVAAANMFIKRNAKYFLMESKNGITYFKLSNLGQRLVNQFVPAENMNVSESVKTARKNLSSILESTRKNRLNERMKDDPGDMGYGDDDDDDLEDDVDINDDEDLEDIIPDDEDIDDDLEADDIDDEGAADEVEFDDDERFSEGEGEAGAEKETESDQFEYEEDDEKIVLTYYKNAPEDKTEGAEDLEDDEFAEKDMDDDLETDDDDLEAEDIDDDNDLEEDADRPKIDPEDVDFDEDAVLDDMDEAEKTPQFPTNKFHTKKKSKAKYHNLLTGNQVKDNADIDSIEAELTENAGRVKRMKQIIENLRTKRGESVNEADEADELTDADLDQPENDAEGTEDTGAEDTSLDGDEGVEKVEITEFIITVDDPDAAIAELEELGIGGERVPIEAKPEEVPVDTETEPSTDDIPAETPEDGEELNLEEKPTEEKSATESLKAFFNKNYLNEVEQPEEEAGASDELGLGDQGAEATELDAPEEINEPTTEFEENKIKVKAEDWDILKGWLEEKGVDVKEMFGGDIETEEVDPDAEASEVGSEEVSDDDIDFSGISDDDDTKVDDKEKEE